MKIYALLVGLLLTISVQAQQPVEVDDRIEERNFMPYELMYYKDLTNAVTFEQISSPAFSTKFQQHTDYRTQYDALGTKSLLR